MKVADPRTAQAERVADYLEAHPAGATLPDLEAACDLGSASKVIADMRGPLGYGIRRAWRRVPLAHGKGERHRRVYVLISRPSLASQLAINFE